MTKAEKKLRADIRADFRERGIIPPPKKPLNRKKFIKDAETDWDKQTSVNRDYYLIQAIGVMLGKGSFRPTAETVGVAKTIKIACEMMRFHEEKAQAGEKTYSVKEMLGRIAPILNA